MIKKIISGAIIISLLSSFPIMADESKKKDFLVVAEQSENYICQNITEISGKIATDKIMLLAQLIEAEAGNQDIIGMMYVGNVVLNRVNSPAYPNNIEEVIYQPGQFTVIRNGRFNRVRNSISANAVTAAIAAMSGNGDQGILYFGTRPRNGIGHWKYGGHWFSY